MEIKLVKISGKGSYKRSVVEKKQFIQLFEGEGKTKKWFKSQGIGHRIWKETLNHWGYDARKIEQLRVAKILSGTCIGKRITQFSERVDNVAKHFPSIKLALESYESNPELMAETISDINSKMHDLKEDLRKIHKHTRQRLKRKRVLPINFVANHLEHRVYLLLRELGLECLPSFMIKNRVFDFYIPAHNLLIEVDGRYHTPEKDLIKDGIAKRNGYKLLRILEEEVKYVYKVKNKIRKACR